MNGQMSRYRASLQMMGNPISISEIKPIKLDLSALMKYAKKQNKKVAELTETEKAQFIGK